MNEYNSTIFTTLLLFTLVISLFTVSADDSKTNAIDNLNNDTNSTNSTNNTKSNASVKAPIQPMSVTVTVTANPTSLNFGAVNADGLEHTFTGATTVRVQALGLSGDLYVRASGDFINSANASQKIPLTNFKYDCPGYAAKKPFTTNNELIHHYTYFLIYDTTYTMNYYLTIPTYTDPGVYSTTVIYTAT